MVLVKPEPTLNDRQLANFPSDRFADHKLKSYNGISFLAIRTSFFRCSGVVGVKVKVILICKILGGLNTLSKTIRNTPSLHDKHECLHIQHTSPFLVISQETGVRTATGICMYLI